MNRPRRIALLLATPGTTWGGMEKHTLELARGLCESGHEVHILADEAYHESFSNVSHFHAIPVQYSRRHPWLGLRLRRLLRRIQPDICHAQGNKAAQLLGNVKRRRGTTESLYVGTLHGTKSSHRAFSRLDGVIAVSDDIGDALEHPNKTVIFNGLGVSMPNATTTFDIPAERPLVIAAGRLETVKGFDRLLQAWSLVAEHGQLVILGEGSARGKLEKQVKQLALTDHVALPGYETNVGEWLRKADLCVISSDREGFPYILSEALLSECPVISTPVSGVSPWLPENCIARSSAADDIAACLSLALADLKTLRKNQMQAFVRAADALTRDAMIRQTVAFYDHLAGSVPGSDAGR